MSEPPVQRPSEPLEMPHYSASPTPLQNLRRAGRWRIAGVIVLLLLFSLIMAAQFVVITIGMAFLVNAVLPQLSFTGTLLGALAGVLIGAWIAGRMLRLPVRLGLTPGSRRDRPPKPPAYPRRSR